MFDSRYKRPKHTGRTVATILVAGLLHAAAIGGIALAGILAAMMAKQVINQEPIELVFRSPPPPPPPPPGGSGKPKAKKKPKVEKKPEKKPEMVQPEEIPEVVPEETEPIEVAETEEPEIPGGMPGGVPGGIPGGVPGGIPGGVPGGTGDGPIDVESIGITPIALFQPQPPYPAIARNANLTGTVIIEIIVSVTGEVTSAKIVKSQPPFDDPALKTVKKWRYQPVIVNGRPIVWKSKINLRFQLR